MQGLDGLIDMLHYSGYFRGTVEEMMIALIDVHPVIPQTIEWELEERNGRRFIPYRDKWARKCPWNPARQFPGAD